MPEENDAAGDQQINAAGDQRCGRLIDAAGDRRCRSTPQEINRSMLQETAGGRCCRRSTLQEVDAAVCCPVFHIYRQLK
ncbi:hypothetical protein ABVT39_003915 [Epinephelus coioides]